MLQRPRVYPIWSSYMCNESQKEIGVKMDNCTIMRASNSEMLQKTWLLKKHFSGVSSYAFYVRARQITPILKISVYIDFRHYFVGHYWKRDLPVVSTPLAFPSSPRA